MKKIIMLPQTGTEDMYQKQTKGHLDAAEAYHSEAAYHLNEGNYQKAAESAILAQESINRANEVRKAILIYPPFCNKEKFDIS